MRSAEVLAWTVSAFCGVAVLHYRLIGARAQRAAEAIQPAPAAAALHLASWSPAPAPPTSKMKPVDPRQVIARLEIPALHLSTPIVDGVDDDSLMEGAGHVRGTALPGGLGNFVVAAHRDTYFRPLAGIHRGMQIRVVTPQETFTYVVDTTRIVLPDQVDVLDIGDVPQMTLITCYPFHYIGSAPKRFTVQAHLLSF